MAITIAVGLSFIGISAAANTTSNLYKDIIKYLDIPEPLIVAIAAVAGLLFFIIFLLFCSRYCFKKCCGDTADKDKYKKRKLEAKNIEKILKETINNSLNENYGKIYFSMKYNLVKELLMIKIIRVDELPKSIDGSLDPYITVRIQSKSNNEEKRTKIKMKTEHPVFNEKFNYKIPHVELIDSSIVFKVFDYDKFGADSLLGQLIMHFKDENMGKIINVLSEFAKDLEQGEDQSSGMGQLCVILNNTGQLGLSVTILEAKNVRIKENSNYSHMFATVKLKSRQDFSKLKTYSKKRTKDCPYTQFPYFNESFSFQKPHGKIIDCQISIKLWMSGLFKMATCIGYILLGLDVSLKSGEVHWKSMLDNPRHPIAKWHILMTPSIKEI